MNKFTLTLRLHLTEVNQNFEFPVRSLLQPSFTTTTWYVKTASDRRSDGCETGFTMAGFTWIIISMIIFVMIIFT
ncbi:MAG: hypothetical protein WAM14_04845 [Candidatus Nitrosopolaris sp.]